MPSLLERLGVELPVVQAGMGGGLSRHELAAAVSEAGGLGTIAVSGADSQGANIPIPRCTCTVSRTRSPAMFART